MPAFCLLSSTTSFDWVPADSFFTYNVHFDDNTFVDNGEEEQVTYLLFDTGHECVQRIFIFVRIVIGGRFAGRTARSGNVF
jgi:hypothetical protein